MTKNTWMSVPAGAFGQGSADARPFGVVAVGAAAQPPFALLRGTGLPAVRVRGLGDVLGLVDGTAVVDTVPAGTPCTPRGEFIARRFVAKHRAVGTSAQYDGTTLGFHTSSRPPS